MIRWDHEAKRHKLSARLKALDRFIDKEASWGGEEDFEKAERATPQAAAEIAFQYAALSAIEAAPSAQSRDAILAGVERALASNER